jgi:hypothetical protein
VHALDGVGRRLGHHDPGAGRTGEADHVDIGMAADRGAHAGAIALDQVEHAGRHAGGIHHFGQDRGAGRAFFRRLEHHGVARRQGRRHFQRDLVEWPVPGRDQADDADRFISHLERAVVFHELEILERGDRAHEAADARADLGGAGKAERRAHFLGHGVGKVGNALLVFFHHAAKQGEPFLARGAAERLEGAARGSDGGIDIGRGAQRDRGARFLGRRVDHFMATATLAIDPLAVDVMLKAFAHRAFSNPIS